MLILQHPRERRHPFGTARMVRLALPQAQLAVPRIRFSGDLDAELQVPADAAVLFPHDQAIDIASLPAHQRPSLLIVLDGTWAQARSLHRQNPWLHGLRHLRLQPSEPSRYRIRREPRADYVATLEAIVAALRVLEPETAGLERLSAAFDGMVERQIAQLDQATRRGRTRRIRDVIWRRVPEAIATPALIVVYGEGRRTPHGAQQLELADLLQLTALRLDTGEVFDATIRDDAQALPLAAATRAGLAAADLAAATSRAEIRRRFVAFTGATPVFAAWNDNSLAWAGQLLGATHTAVSLKVAYSNLHNRPSGKLEAAITSLGLTPAPIACRGRAAIRLGNAVALASWLREQHEEHGHGSTRAGAN